MYVCIFLILQMLTHNISNLTNELFYVIYRYTYRSEDQHLHSEYGTYFGTRHGQYICQRQYDV